MSKHCDTDGGLREDEAKRAGVVEWEDQVMSCAIGGHAFSLRGNEFSLTLKKGG